MRFIYFTLLLRYFIIRYNILSIQPSPVYYLLSFIYHNSSFYIKSFVLTRISQAISVLAFTVGVANIRKFLDKTILERVASTHQLEAN